MANIAGFAATNPLSTPVSGEGSRREAELLVRYRKAEEEAEGHTRVRNIYIYGGGEGSWKRGGEECAETDKEGLSSG